MSVSHVGRVGIRVGGSVRRARVTGRGLGLQPGGGARVGVGGCADVVDWVLAPQRGPRPNLQTCDCVSNMVKGTLQL